MIAAHGNASNLVPLAPLYLVFFDVKFDMDVPLKLSLNAPKSSNSPNSGLSTAQSTGDTTPSLPSSPLTPTYPPEILPEIMQDERFHVLENASSSSPCVTKGARTNRPQIPIIWTRPTGQDRHFSTVSASLDSIVTDQAFETKSLDNQELLARRRPSDCFNTSR